MGKLWGWKLYPAENIWDAYIRNVNGWKHIQIHCLFRTLNIKSDYFHIPDFHFIVAMDFAD